MPDARGRNPCISFKVYIIDKIFTAELFMDIHSSAANILNNEHYSINKNIMAFLAVDTKCC